MISRRNIRVKVMQTLYAVETMDSEVKPDEPLRILQKHFDQSRGLLVYLVHVLTEVARYAETDSRKRAGKHLPTEADLNVNTKLAGNELLWKIMEDSSYKEAVRIDKPSLLADKDQIKRLYLGLKDSEEYKVYIAEQGRNPRAEKQMLEYIFSTLMLPDENFTDHVEELYTNWDDDCDMVNQLVLGFLQKPGAVDFMELVSKDKLLFAKDLLNAVITKKELTMDMIKPKLKNWDPERIALLDMILMKMGVCEFLYFETIPPKVTINEYIDLAKDYSTQQSGQFVNGILDNIHKDLLTDERMHKVAFKKNNS
ncbi:MAG: transcription antitermination factor NusB [Gemmatimonadaceae bacterium]|nr:transcription antitermination factor NusB [Chitinophagaceae bacterium]